MNRIIGLLVLPAVMITGLLWLEGWILLKDMEPVIRVVDHVEKLMP